MRYRSKVVEIDAFRYEPETSEYFRFMPEWLESAYDAGAVNNIGDPMDAANCKLAITTLEGVMTAQPGDYIIRGTEGELYPCKPSVFERKYEPVPVTATHEDGK